MKVIRALLGIVCALVVWEIILRQAVVANPGYHEHTALGHIQRPGPTVFSREGFSRTTFNSLGMRGPEPSPKRPGEVRILAIGDSLTVAQQVPDDATYCALLQAGLEQALKRPVTVVNAGRAGDASAHYLQLADFYRKTFQPDYVIVQLDESDFREETFSPAKSFYMVPDADGFHIAVQANAGRVDHPLLLASRQHPLLAPLVHLQGLMVFSTVRTAIDRVVSRIYGAPWMQRMTVQGHHGAHYADLVRWAVPRLKDRYPGSVLLYLPEEANAPTDVERLVGTTARRHGADYLNLRREFFSAVLSAHPPRGFDNTVPGYGHLNETGHRLVAARLTAYFKQRITP